MHRTAKALAGLAAGALCGLFFGDLCRVLEPAATAFVKLMQMAVIPYVVVSIIGGIGALSRAEAKTVARKGGLLLVSLWALGLAVFFSMQFAFPHRPSASFYSASEVAKPETSSIIDTFIPANPFKALAEGILPAIVLFSICLGVALIGAEDRKAFLEILRILSAALTRIMGFLISMIPIGIFVIAAYAVGTLPLDTLYQLQFFCESYIVLALVLIFVALPLIAALFTGCRYRDILYASSGALLLAFSAQKTFIALPLIESGVRELLAKRPAADAKAGAYTEVLVPIAYNFPTYGDFGAFLFVIFVAWLYNTPLAPLRQLHCALAGVFSLFGSGRNAVPFLLTLARLPEDAFELYLGSSPVNGHFGAALSCMFLFSFTAACVALMSGGFKARGRMMAVTGLAVVASLACVVGGLRAGFSLLLRDAYHGDEMMASMELPGAGDGAPYMGIAATVVRAPGDGAGSHAASGTPPRECLARILERRALRVGYNEEALPFSFFNRRGALVGYDVQMAYELASFLGVGRIEFVPVAYDALAGALDGGRCDIIMAGVVITPERLRKMRFTASYMASHLALITQDYRKHEFSSLAKLRGMPGLSVAALKGTAYEEILPRVIPCARHVRLETEKEFFSGGKADALLTTAEEGAPWTLLHPSYCVVALGRDEGTIFLHAYAVPEGGDDSLLRFANAFIDMERAHGALQQKYDYWVLGKNPYVKRPRWSVLRDVLHWVK